MPSLLKTFFKRAELADTSFGRTERSNSNASFGSFFSESGSESDRSVDSRTSRMSASSLVTAVPTKKEKCKATTKPGAKRHAPPAVQVQFCESPQPSPQPSSRSLELESLGSSKSAPMDMNNIFEDRSDRWFTAPRHAKPVSEKTRARSSGDDSYQVYDIEDQSWCDDVPKHAKPVNETSPKSITYDLDEIFMVQDVVQLDSWYQAPRPNLHIVIPKQPQMINNYLV